LAPLRHYKLYFHTKFLLPVIVLMIVSESFGQTTWQKFFGGAGEEDSRSVTGTPDGFLFSAGITNSFGAGGKDFLFLKLDPQGDTVWLQTYGGTGDDVAYSLATTADGGFVLAGHTSSFGSGIDCWLVRTGSSGDTLWTRTYGGPYIDWCLSVAKTTDSGFILAGFTDHIQTDALLIRTDPMGDTIWSKTFGGVEDDWISSVVQTPDGGFAATGFTKSFSIDGSEDLWLIRVDSAGDLVWSKTYGGSGNDWGRAITLTGDQGFIIAGGSSSYSHGGDDLWLLKTNAGGDSLWSRNYGGESDDWAYSSVLQVPGGYACIGTTTSRGAGLGDVWLLKTNLSGDTLWTRTYGGAEFDYGSSVFFTSENGFFTGGGTQSFGQGNSDAYLLLTDSSGNITPGTGINHPDSLPMNSSLYIYSNPVISETSIRFFLPEKSDITLEIATIKGVIVKRLTSGVMEQGIQTVRWNGCDDRNSRPAPGVYLVILKRAHHTCGQENVIVIRKKILLD